MPPLELIDKYYATAPKARQVLLEHSGQVARLASSIARRISQNSAVDIDFVEESAWLHDIGMIKTDVPKFECFGDEPYICHGVLGAEILRVEALPRHALVCERHIGVGLTIDDIRQQRLPLPLREMSPQTLEEEIVTYADLFFSKSRKGKKSIEDVRRSVAKHGKHRLVIFEKWHQQFRQPEE